MAKSETIQICCDRCQKVMHRPVKSVMQAGEGVKLSLAWQGKIECTMDDLCPRCFEIVKKVVDRLKRVAKEEAVDS